MLDYTFCLRRWHSVQDTTNLLRFFTGRWSLLPPADWLPSLEGLLGMTPQSSKYHGTLPWGEGEKLTTKQEEISSS